MEISFVMMFNNNRLLIGHKQVMRPHQLPYNLQLSSFEEKVETLILNLGFNSMVTDTSLCEE